MLTVANRHCFSLKCIASLCVVVATLASCSSPVELKSHYCSEITRHDKSESAMRNDLDALDAVFAELEFQIDDHLDSDCVKTYWGRDSATSVNVCTTKTIVTTYGRDNVRNKRLDDLVEAEVNRVFSGRPQVAECSAGYGFSIVGWPDVASKL